MPYQQGPSSWYMEQSREHQMGQGQHMPRCIQRSGWRSEPNWDPGLQLTSMAIMHCQDLASMFKHAQVTPKSESYNGLQGSFGGPETLFKASQWDVLLLDPSNTFLHSTPKFKTKQKKKAKKKSSRFACKGGRRHISQCLDKQNVSGFHLTQAKELPAHALEL